MSDQDWVMDKADKLYRAIFTNIEAGNEDACVSMLIGALCAAKDSGIEEALVAANAYLLPHHPVVTRISNLKSNKENT